MQTVATEDKEHGTVRIHCPACGRRDVEGRIIERRETMMEAMVIPVASHTTWWVICPDCKTRLFSNLPGSELTERSPDELVGVVYQRVSLIHKFFAVASVLLAVTPCMGLCIGAIALALNWKSSGWPKTVSKIGLGLSALVHAGGVLLMIIDIASRRR